MKNMNRLRKSSPAFIWPCALACVLLPGQPTNTSEADPTSSETTIWFDTPASDYTESSPMGNGRLGAMMFGGVDEERIVLNVSKADEVILFIAAVTDYHGFAGRQLDDPVAATLDDLNKASAVSCNSLRKAHIADYQQYWKECPYSGNKLVLSTFLWLPKELRVRA